MRFVIITGMSGAGKSTALKMLEDMAIQEDVLLLCKLNLFQDLIKVIL